MPRRDASPGEIPQIGSRIVVVGSSGSGKTTIARTLSRVLGIPHIELDALHWDPGWTMAPTEEFRLRVDQALQGDAWVTDGNYSKVRDIIWTRADTLVWLDLRLSVIMARLVRRTLLRSVTRVELWNGNRESVRSALSRDSILLWALQTYHGRRREYTQVPAEPRYSHLSIVRLRTPRDVRRWLRRIR